MELVAKSKFYIICAGYHSYRSETKSKTYENFNNFILWKLCHHLRIVQQPYGKDQHGLREKDLNPVD